MDEISVQSIVRKMKQGLTEPYLCSGDDNNQYVVKGSNANASGLVREWIAAHVGRDFGLPIPPFRIAWLDDMLVQYSSYNINAGYCFASAYQPNIQEITFNQLSSVDSSILKDLFVFDYWIKNSDRNLTNSGGNANLFFDHKSHEIHVLDHNLAFATDFDPEVHRALHVGAKNWKGLDLVDQLHYEKKFEKATIAVDNAINSIPTDWLERYSLSDINEEIVTVLNSYTCESFWEGIKK